MDSIRVCNGCPNFNWICCGYGECRAPTAPKSNAVTSIIIGTDTLVFPPPPWCPTSPTPLAASVIQ